MFSKSAPANGMTAQQFQKLQQQQLQQMQYQFNAMNGAQMDPSLFGFGSPMIKQEIDPLDPTDPFSMSSDFGDFASIIGGGVGASLEDLHGQHRRLPNHQDPNSMLSPLSTSPLDNDYDPTDEFTTHSIGSYSDYGSAPNAFQTPTPGTSAPLKSANLHPQQRRPGVHPKTVDSTNVVAAAAAAAAAAASGVHQNTATSHFLNLQSQLGGSLPSGHAPGAFFSMSMPVSHSGFGAMDAATAAAVAAKSAGSSISSNGGIAPLMSSSSGSTSSFKGFKGLAGSPSGSVLGATPSSVSSGSMKAKDGTPFSAVDDAEARSFSMSLPPSSSTSSHPPSVEILNEKRRRRRESHNAVERRRRDNINEKIQELSTLLPDFPTEAQNKGAILRRSVEYIKMMQALATRQQERMRELENCVRGLLLQAGATEQDLMLTVPLGTVFELPQIPMSFGRDMDM